MEESIVKYWQEMGEEIASARSRLYPDAPDTPNVKLTHPIDQYAGTYSHVGYGTLTFSLEKDSTGEDVLRASMEDRTWKAILIMQHVNAEYWLVTKPIYNTSSKQASRAESKVGVNGKVVALGIAMESAMPDHLFWFSKTP